MPLRSDASAHPASADSVAAVRLSFPGRLAGTAGEDLETPRLSARARARDDETQWELDNLFVAGATLRGAGGEPEVPARLRFVRSGLSQGFAAPREFTGELLQTRWRFRRGSGHLVPDERTDRLHLHSQQRAEPDGRGVAEPDLR